MNSLKNEAQIVLVQIHLAHQRFVMQTPFMGVQIENHMTAKKLACFVYSIKK